MLSQTISTQWISSSSRMSSAPRMDFCVGMRTRQVLWGLMVTRPSISRRLIASRAGVGLTSSSLAMSLMFRVSP